MKSFERIMRPSQATRILDVGGSPLIWQFASVLPRLAFLNLPTALMPPPPRGEMPTQVAGDGCMLPFRDREFDIVFSNSVIEHVGSLENQRRFASEAARVGRSYWIQTPNRRFPLELHSMLPMVHYFPKSLQRNVLTRFTVWELLVRPSKEERSWYVNHLLDELKLLDAREFASLFPGATILKERFLGLTKSIVALKAP